MLFHRAIPGVVLTTLGLLLWPANISKATDLPTSWDPISAKEMAFEHKWNEIARSHEESAARAKFREARDKEVKATKHDRDRSVDMPGARQFRSDDLLDSKKTRAANDATNAESMKRTNENLERASKYTKAYLDAANAAMEYYKALKIEDERMKPNYEPRGAPTVPSQCMEDEDCRPCYEDAQRPINVARKNLEKVRAISEYTNNFTKKGQALLTAAGTAGPYGIAGIEAVHQVQVAETELKKFNDVVKKKNKDFLVKVDEGLHKLSSCEARYYKNDDWYNRYGFIYYQFMMSRYETN